MNRVKEWAIRLKTQPRVSHRLPGRLRLHIPLLRKLPEDWAALASILEEALAAPEGIRRAKGDRRTGSLLIDYDPEQLKESDILAYLRGLLNVLLRYHHQIEKLDKAGSLRAARKLHGWLQTHTRTCPQLDAQMDVPDEIWS